MKLLNKISTLKEWTIIISFSLIAIILFGGFSYLLTYKHIKKYTTQTAVSILNSTISETETNIENIISNIPLLINDTSARNLFLSSKDNTIHNDMDVTKTANTINAFKNCNSFIDDIHIINRSHGFVVSSTGKHSIDDFFSNHYSYKNYPSKFWKTLYAVDDAYGYTRYSPSAVNSTGNSTKQVIPIVFSKIMDTPSSNLVVVNISIPALIAYAQQKTMDPSIHFSMLNKQSKQLFSLSSKIRDIQNSELYDSILSSRELVTKSTVNESGKKLLILANSPKESILGYTYIVEIPYSYIFSQISSITWLLILFFVIFFGIGLFLFFYSSKYVISPVRQLAKNFNINQNSSNLINNFHATMLEIREANESLNKSIMPFFHEKYLINIINSNEYLNDEQGLKDFSPKFEYNYFSIIIFQLHPKEKLRLEFSSLEYQNIQLGLYNTIETLFLEKFPTFIIASEYEALYVLINCETKDEDKKICNIINSIKELLLQDLELVELSIGYGGIHEGIDGIKEAHKKALDSIHLVTVPSTNHIVFDKSQFEKSVYYLFTPKDEDKLYSLLISDKTEDALAFIEEKVEYNKRNIIPHSSLKQLYTQMLNIILRVMRIKNIPYDEHELGDIFYVKKIIDMPIPQIHKAVLKNLEMIKAMRQSMQQVSAIENIISYIDEHICEDLYLDLLADTFQVTPDYISKAFKKKKGVGFHEYITIRRIEIAKELLSTTHMSVQDIYTQCGFRSKSTFIRTFKSIVGKTPSKFRE